MCELLVKAQDSTAAESAGKWRAGRIVAVMPDGHEWGDKEGLPDFYLIKVPGVTVDAAKAYLAEWNHDPAFELTASQVSTDSYRYKMTSSAVAAGGKGTITLSQVRNFFENWGASIFASTSDSVTFEFTVFDLATSNKFWSKDVSAITFTDDYDQTDHTILVGAGPTDEQIERNCLINDVEYVAPRSFKVTRNQIRQAMQADINAALQRVMVDRRRWYITGAGMTALANNGGVLTVTPAQLVNNLRDGYLD